MTARLGRAGRTPFIDRDPRQEAASDRLVLAVHTPPVTDGLWGYEPSRAPGVNTVYRDPERPSSVLLPLVAWTDAEPPAPACGEPAGYRCL